MAPLVDGEIKSKMLEQKKKQRRKKKKKRKKVEKKKRKEKNNLKKKFSLGRIQPGTFSMEDYNFDHHAILSLALFFDMEN